METLPDLNQQKEDAYYIKNSYYYKLTRRKRYLWRITITGGKNIIGMILGIDKVNLQGFKYNIKYKKVEGDKVIIIIEETYSRCNRCNRCNSTNINYYLCPNQGCKNIDRIYTQIEELKVNFYKKYKKICKKKGIKYEDRKKDENMFEFKSDIKYKVLFDYYIHPEHIAFIKGKNRKYINYLKSIYNCDIYIHRNKSSNLIKSNYGLNYFHRKNVKYFNSYIGTTKICVKINPLYMYHFLKFITINILHKAQKIKNKNLHRYNPLIFKNTTHLRRHFK